LSSLRGKSKPSVSFTLTDQLLRPVHRVVCPQVKYRRRFGQK
jgi:hypothetical protein